jgi:hypothetical protein
MPARSNRQDGEGKIQAHGVQHGLKNESATPPRSGQSALLLQKPGSAIHCK